MPNVGEIVKKAVKGQVKAVTDVGHLLGQDQTVNGYGLESRELGKYRR